MNLKDLEESTGELRLKISEIKDILNLKKERLNTINENSLGTKSIVIASISMSFYSFLLIFIILNGGNVLPNCIPVNLISPIITLSSVGVGVVGEKLLRKIKKGNRKISKNRIMELEEKIKLEIEYEKCINKEKALQNSINMLNTYENIIKAISNETRGINISLKEENEEELYETLEKQYKKLDELTTKKVINEKFCVYKDKIKSFVKILSISMASALCSIIVFKIPNVILSDILSTSSSLLNVIIPLAIGGTTGGLYTIKNNSDSKKVYDKLKEEYRLDEFSNKSIKNEIEQTIKNISILENKIQENKRIKEKIEDAKEKEENNKVLQKSFDLSAASYDRPFLVDFKKTISNKGPVKKIGQKK